MDEHNGKKSSNAKSRAAADERARFYRLASHQLRGPLASIQSSLKAIAGGYVPSVEGKALEMIKGLDLKAKAMLEMLGDMLILAKLRETDVASTKRELDLHDLAEKAMNNLDDAARAGLIEVEYDAPEEPMLIIADPEGVYQVIYQTLLNAINYSKPGGLVELSFKESAGLKGWLGIVKDQGIGLPFEDRENVFKEFFRAANAKAYRPEGSGLGLSICEAAVLAHGGWIKIESAGDAAAIATFYLPC